MPKPICEVCKKEMTFSKDADWDAGYWYCFGDHVEGGVDLPHAIMHENAQAEYITTLEAELTALRQQVAALQAAQPREPLVIEWNDNSNHLSFDDMIDEELAAGTVRKNATVDQPTE